MNVPLAVERVATLEVCQIRAVCCLLPGPGEGLIMCLWNIINADHGNLLTERGLGSSLPPQIWNVCVFFPLIFSLSSSDYNETFPGTQLLVVLWTYNTGEKRHWLNFHNGQHRHQLISSLEKKIGTGRAGDWLTGTEVGIVFSEIISFCSYKPVKIFFLYQRMLK